MKRSVVALLHPTSVALMAGGGGGHPSSPVADETINYSEMQRRDLPRVQREVDPLASSPYFDGASSTAAGSTSGGGQRGGRQPAAAATKPRRPPMPVFKRMVDRHQQEESARFVKREQYTRIYEFLKGLRKAENAADHWQVSVAALRDAASRGTPMTSDLIAEAIESCFAAKQYETANELFYKFHFDFNVERGPKASLAFLRVCAATGQYDAAKRVVEWIGGGVSSAEEDLAASSSSTSSNNLLEDGTDADAATTTSHGGGDVPPAKSDGLEADEGAEDVIGVEGLFGGGSANRNDASSASSSSRLSFALTAEMMTLFIRSAVTAASVSPPSSREYFHFHIYKDSLETYQRLRMSARNAPTIVTSPHLVEALVTLHSTANKWGAAYELFLKSVRLLAVDSGRIGGGGSNNLLSSVDDSQPSSGITVGKASRLRQLVQYGDEERLSEAVAKEAREMFSSMNNGGDGTAASPSSSSAAHDELLSDGSLTGNTRMTESALDDILAKFGVKNKKKTAGADNGGGDAMSAAEEGLLSAADDGERQTKTISLETRQSLDDMLAASESGRVGTATLVEQQRALSEKRRAQSEEEHRNYSELNSRSSVVLASARAAAAAPSRYVPHVGPLPSNITFITQETFDAVIRCCFKAKRHLQAFKTAQLAVALGPAASNNYAPDEAAARMLIFSIEEVTAQIYEVVGGNIPSMQFKREYLKYCAAERDRIRAALVAKKTAVRDAAYNALKKDGRLLDGGSDAAAKSHSLPPIRVSETELLMALPDEIVASTRDLTSRLNAYKLSTQLFKGLANNGFALFPQTYESPFRTLIAAGQVELAAEMVEEMRKDGRAVPQYCYHRLLCEKIAHSTSSKAAEEAFESLRTMTNVKHAPAAFNALLRHSIAVDNRKLFKETSSKMLNLEVVENKEKLILTIRARIAAGNHIGALAAYSRLNNSLSYEAKRTAGETDHASYNSDYFVPRPVLQQLADFADEYISSQQSRKEKVQQQRGGSDAGSGEDDDEDAIPPHRRKVLSSSSVQDTKAFPEYWNQERERNLEMARVVRLALAERLDGGVDGQYIGREASAANHHQLLSAAAGSSVSSSSAVSASPSRRNSGGGGGNGTASSTTTSHVARSVDEESIRDILRDEPRSAPQQQQHGSQKRGHADDSSPRKRGDGSSGRGRGAGNQRAKHHHVGTNNGGKKQKKGGGGDSFPSAGSW